jgi:beta-xylosidase
MGAAIGRDMRRSVCTRAWPPVLDVVRDYRWGRVEETMGEDPVLVAMLGTAYVRGLESAGVSGRPYALGDVHPRAAGLVQA